MSDGWISFKDKLPSMEQAFVTDFKEVWVQEDRVAWDYFAATNPGLYWRPLELPPVPTIPKKTPHHCQKRDWVCDETQSGLLLACHSNPYAMVYVDVECCPLCGYSIKEAK